jgi:hypothetical protein
MSASVRVPVFSSPTLQKSYQRVRPILEGVEDTRNQVSQDIKELESYLLSLSLTTPFRLEFGKRGSASGEIEEEALVWSEHATKWRLLYEVVRWEGEVEPDIPGGPFFVNEETAKRQVKPLIESKLDVRQRMHERLGEFLRALASDIAAREHLPYDAMDWEEDIPF